MGYRVVGQGIYFSTVQDGWPVFTESQEYAYVFSTLGHAWELAGKMERNGFGKFCVAGTEVCGATGQTTKPMEC